MGRVTAGNTTSASSPVSVRKMSCTTRWSGAVSRRITAAESASDCTGVSPMT